MDRNKAVEELERIQQDLQRFRTNHGTQAALYISKKAEYQVKEAKFIKNELEKNATKTKTYLKEVFMDQESDLYVEYKEAKAEMEGLDRSLRNLDTQRSIIQTVLNQLDKE